LFLLVFAGLQYNDPDPLQWVAIYGATGVALMAAGWGKQPPHVVARVVGLAAICYAVWLAPGFDVNWLESEDAYEFGGLILVGIAWYSFIGRDRE